MDWKHPDWFQTAGYFGQAPDQVGCPWLACSGSSEQCSVLLARGNCILWEVTASNLSCSRWSRRSWRVDISVESLLIDSSRLRTGFSVWVLLVWCDRASLLLFKTLVKIRMTTRVATAQSVKMSRRKWGSMELCSGVSVEEGSELVADGRADFWPHIWSRVRVQLPS